MRTIQDPPFLDGMVKLTSHAEIDEVLRSAAFEQGSHQESEPFFRDSLLMIGGDRHFERRRLEAQLFGKEALQHYERTALQPVIAECIDKLSAQRSADGRVRTDLVPLTRTMLHRITATIIGLDGAETDDGTERLRRFIEQLGEAVTVEWSTRDHREVVEEGLKIRNDFVEQFFRPSVERRLDLIARHRSGSLPAEELPRDLLTLMHMHWDSSWDDELALRESTLYMVAATQTTTHAAPHVVAHLAEWFELHGEDRALTADLDFLRRAATESLRLHLPAPALIRRALTDVTLSSGRTIPQGQRVALLFRGANREKDRYGSDADTFDPFRTIDDPAVKPWGLTFGGGEHMCVGRPLVTGTGQRGSDDSTAGTIVQILAALYRAGVVLDPDHPPEFSPTSHFDSYSSFPVILTEL